MNRTNVIRQALVTEDYNGQRANIGRTMAARQVPCIVRPNIAEP